MSRYLDPKADVVFKKIFGEHPELLKSFLNAVLPLPENGLITKLSYLPSEQVPIIPAFKCTVVDVKCTDQRGQVFIVEMQIQWTTYFQQRLLFNASKAYVQQLEKGEEYKLLKPVYGLALINDRFNTDENEWYHHYKLVNVKDTNTEIKDLQLVFIELPKFKARNFQEKKLQVLWLRFMSELNDKTKEVPPEWLAVPEIKAASFLAEEAAYSPAELDSYERYWTGVSSERTLVSDALSRGEEEGMRKGMEKGIAEGIKEARLLIARQLLDKGMSPDEVVAVTGIAQASKLPEKSPK